MDEEAADEPVTLADVDERLNAARPRRALSRSDETLVVESARGAISLTRHRVTTPLPDQHP